MSAVSLFEPPSPGSALASGGVGVAPEPVSGSTGHQGDGEDRGQPPGRPERRSQGALQRISREFDALCTRAVEPAEIVAGLEAVGYTDRVAVQHGCADLFELAERLFRLTPRRAATATNLFTNPWVERPIRHLLRGVSFALSGLVFAAVLPRTSSPSAVLALTAALMLSWPISQTTAFLGHTLAGRNQPLAARAVLLGCLALACLPAAGFAMTALRLGLPPVLAVVGAGEIVYLAATAVILVVGHELLALAALAPAVVVSAVAAVTDSLPGSVVAAAAGCSLLAAVTTALVLSRQARGRDLRTGMAALTRGDLAESGVQFAYGLAGAVLITLPTLAGYGSQVGSWYLMPLIWSMGFAEWSVTTFRRAAHDRATEAITMLGFRRRVQRAAGAALLRYLGALSVLTAIVVAARWKDGALPTSGQLVGFGAGWVLGAGLFVGLLLSSLGRLRSVVTAMVPAIALGAVSLRALNAVSAVIVAPAVLLLLLLPPLLAAVANPTRHL